MTTQERTRRRTEARLKALNVESLEIPVASSEEREYIRSHVSYSGASDTNISSTVGVLGLAVEALLTVRGRHVAKIRRTSTGRWILTSKPARAD